MRTIGDERINNDVYEVRVASGTYADHMWVWRSAPSLGHAHHIHISFAEPAKHDGRPFNLPILDHEWKPAEQAPAKKAPAKKAAKPKP
jgi:hypothetical protein